MFQNLNEEQTPENLKVFLKSKLGCLADNSNTEVSTLLDKSGKKLSKKAQKTLEAIAAGKKTERILKTKFLSKAWKTVKGVNKAIRNLTIKQPAYLFAYLQSGKIIEGTNQLKIYDVDIKDLTEEDVHKRFENAINSISKLCQVNNAALAAGGEAVIAVFKGNVTSSELLNIQKVFKATFTAKEEPQKNSLVSFVKKALKLDLTDSEGKEIAIDDLKQYQFKTTEDIIFPYSAEEVNVAKEALLVLGEKAKEESKDFMKELKKLVDERIKARKTNTDFSFKRVRKLFADYQEDSDEDLVLNKEFLERYNGDSESIEQLKKWFEKLNLKIELDADQQKTSTKTDASQRVVLAIKSLMDQGWEKEKAKETVLEIRKILMGK